MMMFQDRFSSFYLALHDLLFPLVDSSITRHNSLSVVVNFSSCVTSSLYYNCPSKVFNNSVSHHRLLSLLRLLVAVLSFAPGLSFFFLVLASHMLPPFVIQSLTRHRQSIIVCHRFATAVVLFFYQSRAQCSRNTVH